MGQLTGVIFAMNVNMAIIGIMGIMGMRYRSQILN